MRTIAILVLVVLSGSIPRPALAATRADLAPFFRRLESIGLDTAQMRKVAGKIDVYFRKPSSTAEAQYGYIRNNLYIPDTFKEKSSNRVRFDLECHEINTIVHELSHAEYDVCASQKAAKGTPDREHWEAVNAIWSDLFLDDRHKFLGLPRYPRFKADEISSYFIGASIMEVLEGADLIVMYNAKFAHDAIKTPEDAARLGDRLILPAKDHENGFYKRIANLRFGQSKAGNDNAYFENKPIPWNERAWVKEHIVNHVLGLAPPRDAASLCARLNEIDNDWIRKVRSQVKEARRVAAEKVRAESLAAHDAADDPAAAADTLNRVVGIAE